MELRHLTYFVTVAAECNFTRAAERLNVAQPPLSRQIRELERELGVALFDRDCRPIRLTEAGRLFYERAVQILADVEQMRATMGRFSTAGRKQFVVGSGGAAIYGRLPQLIRQFREACPHIDVRLVELTTLEQISALKEKRIDAGIGRIQIDDPAISRRMLHLEPLVVAVPSGHRLTLCGSPIKLSALANEILILYPSHPRPSFVDQALVLSRDHGLNPALVHEVRELQTALSLVAAQGGLCILPASIKNMRREGVDYLDLADPHAVAPLIVSWRTADASDELAQFLQISMRLYAEAQSPIESHLHPLV